MNSSIVSAFLTVLLFSSSVVAVPYSQCKEVSQNITYPGRKLYIFCFEGRTKLKFQRYIDVWRWSTYNLRHSQDAVVKVVQAPWNSRSKEKFLTKPRNYLENINEAIKSEMDSGRDVNNAHVILVDSDTLFSNPSLDEVWQRYDCARKGKDLVLATETNCWLGRYCIEGDVANWYKSTPPAYSVFVNSGAIMGTLLTVKEMMVNITTSSTMYFIQGYGGVKFDDQYAVTVYGMERPDITALDVHQNLFGTYQVFDPNSTGDRSPYVCRRGDGEESAYNFHCNDITMEVIKGRSIYMDAGCAIRRDASRVSNLDYRRIFETLAPDPILWHGNGGGKRLYMKHRIHVLKCMYVYYNVNRTAYGCTDNDCGENLV